MKSLMYNASSEVLTNKSMINAYKVIPCTDVIVNIMCMQQGIEFTGVIMPCDHVNRLVSKEK